MRDKIARTTATIVAILLTSGCALAAEEPKVRVTGIYSSLVFNQEGGDVLGEEIIILYSKDGYFSVFQNSEGAPSAPIIVPAKVDGMTISFTLPGPLSKWGEFRGTVTANELTGAFAKIDRVIKLPRKPSYWQ